MRAVTTIAAVLTSQHVRRSPHPTRHSSIPSPWLACGTLWPRLWLTGDTGTSPRCVRRRKWRCDSVAGAVVANSSPSSSSLLLADPATPGGCTQAGGLDAQDWPHALHMLSHVLNKDLCVPLRRSIPVALCHSPNSHARRRELARLVWKRIPELAKQVRRQPLRVTACGRPHTWVALTPTTGQRGAGGSVGPGCRPVETRLPGASERALSRRVCPTGAACSSAHSRCCILGHRHCAALPRLHPRHRRRSGRLCGGAPEIDAAPAVGRIHNHLRCGHCRGARAEPAGGACGCVPCMYKGAPHAFP